MTQSPSDVQNGVLTRRQRRSGQVGQGVPQAEPPTGVNATELLAQNPHPNQDVPIPYTL